MRFISEKNKLDLQTKLKKAGSNKFNPWFSYKHKCLKDVDNIIFGHWAAIKGETKKKDIFGLDTGCVWGDKLTIMRLEDNKRFQINRIKK